MKCLHKIIPVAAALLLSSAACGTDNSQQAPDGTQAPATSTSHAPAAPKTPNAPAAPHTPGAPGTSTVPMMPNPNGDGSMVPCEGTICTNPNHGAGDNPEENGGAVMPNPNGDGSDVPCEGTICTNPNHGAGDNPDENGGADVPAPDGDG
ncbi:hypothetical protein [Mycolicibacterium porcinum]|uniref:hypothetical protein n=1 Tax=Mycolicibacterium porcinum TaxID=39693 RepID=UPI000AD96D5C